MRRNALIALMTVVSGTIAVACSAGNPAAGDGRPAGAVATFRGGIVTEEDMAAVAAKELMRARQELYRAEEKAAREAAYRKIRAEKAAAAGMTPEAWEEKQLAASVEKPDPERVEQLLERFRSRLPKDEKKARQAVVDALERNAREKAREALIDRLLREAGFRLLLEPPRAVVAIQPWNPVEGPEDAPVTIVEFSDFQCPYCSRAADTIHELMAEYGNLIRVVHKPYPLASHTWARKAAEAALCANEQGRYREYHDWLFAHRTSLSDEAFLEGAKDLGLDVDAFRKCYENQAYEERIRESITEGHVLGVTATPSFFIDGRMLEGAQPIERFRRLIDEELQRKGLTPPPHPTPTPRPARKAAEHGGEKGGE